MCDSWRMYKHPPLGQPSEDELVVSTIERNVHALGCVIKIVQLKLQITLVQYESLALVPCILWPLCQ